jgi:uncharacterized protein (TIGR02996 family)
MTSAYHDAFMQEIREAPADDLPRLIYADWLEDHGDASRAEFIRVQIRLARAADDPELRQLRRRESELLHRHGPAWRRPLPAWLRGGLTFRRGFLDEYDGPAYSFFRDETADFFRLAPCPVLRLSRVKPAQIRRLRNTPHVAQVRGLYLSDPDTSADLLVDALHLEKAVRLEELGLAGVRGRTSLRSLLCDPWTHRLRRLALVGCALDDGCLDSLLGWPGLRSLESLDLRDNRFRADGVVRLHSALGLRVRLSPSGV